MANNMKKKFSFSKGYRGRTIFSIFNFIFLAIIMIAMLIPIWKVCVDSVSREVSSTDISLWPQVFTLEAYEIIFSKKALFNPFWVSIYTTAIGTFLGLLISTIGAYILIQRDMPGVKIFSWLFMFTMIFNGGLVPTFLVIVGLGLYDTVWAVIFTLGMNVYNLVLMRSFFEQLPVSLFEAAEIDGCSPFGIFIKIVLPLSKPALASIGLFFAVAYWSEYFHYVLYVTDPDKLNFQVKLRELVLTDEPIPEAKDAGLMSETMKNAAIIVNILPFAIIYPFCQKYFVTGVTLGAVKE